jgi:DnaJ domain
MGVPLMSGTTWYDVLGVLPDAPTEDIRDAWEDKMAALQPATLTGAPADVLPVADRARQLVNQAAGILADPAARASYDEKIGFARPGEGLAPTWRGPSGPDVALGPGWSTALEESLDPYSEPVSQLVVPDVTGLFFSACLDVAGRVSLRVEPVRLTPHPMPVDGLVVSQVPAPGAWAQHNSTLTVHVWHPAEPDGQPSAS